MSKSSPAPDGQSPHATVGQLYRELWRHSLGMRGQLIFGFALLIVSQVVKLAIPALSGRAINQIQEQGAAGLGHAGQLLLMVFLATVVSWIMHGPGRILERNVALHVRRNLSDELLSKLFNAPLTWHEAQHGSETAHRVQQTTRALYDFAQSQFIYLQSATKLIGPVIALCVISLWVGLSAIAGYLVLAAIIVFFDRRLMKLAAVENQGERRYWAALSDVLGSVLAIFSLRMRMGAFELIGRRLHEAFAPMRKAIVYNEAKWAAVDILNQALWIALVMLFVAMSLSGAAVVDPGSAADAATAGVSSQGHPVPAPSVPLGNLFMVYEYALQAGGVITGIAAHFQALTRQQTDYGSAAPVMSAEQTAVVPLAGADDAAQDWRGLDFKGLKFQHRVHAERPAAEDMSLVLARGRRYALIGPSGAGKSTLLRMLAGLYEPDEGSLSIDSRARPGERSTVSGEALRRAVGSIATLVPQEAELFQGTVRENLDMAMHPRSWTSAQVMSSNGLEDASRTSVRREIEDAATSDAPAIDAANDPRGPLTVGGTPKLDKMQRMLRIAQASGFVDRLPKGLEASLGPRASNLSGGQRQRLALARGLLAGSRGGLLLLDEPTSALDPATEHQLIRELFAELPIDCTVVASIHRPQLLELFDEVIVINAGRIVAQGTVAELEPVSEELASFRRLPSPTGRRG